MAVPANNPPISATNANLIIQMRHGDGEMERLIRAFDWTKTPLGAFEGWPQSIRSAVNLMLASRAQIILFAGPAFTTLYNDAYIVVFGSKHPHALGLPASACWSEIWDDALGPLLKGVVATGEAFAGQDYPFVLERHGFAEETYFDISYDPVRDESGKVGSVICIVNETTKRVLSERRLKTLHRLSQTGQGKTTEEACQVATKILSENSADVPFALIYLLDDARSQAHLVASNGIDPASDNMAAPVIDLAAEAKWPLAQVLADDQPALVEEQLSTHFQDMPPDTWPESPHTALVLPITAPGRTRTIGFLIVGVSIRLALDDAYRNFFGLVVGHIASAVANARAHEEERKRAEALAALDRAKTEFFSNVSHEFRTPLTLMLNPLQEVLSDEQALSSQQRENLEVVHRNSLRLLKLVNTLLDFSRIQSNRIQASFEPTELAALTVDLASNFRSVVEHAGLRLIINCPPLPEPVYIDHEMWEKIVLNLISNAFKFTFEGAITVSLHAAADQVEFKVQDTGIGIAETDLPHLFERFHRIRGARSRTYEGSGIGLALVAELVRLHGGQITANSTLGSGTLFTISIPLGTAHLPPDQLGTPRALAATAIGAASYTEEAQRWLVDTGQETALPAAISPVDTTGLDATVPAQPADVTVFIVDDNADMLDYLRRILGSHYRVAVAKDGLTALARIRQQPPDLVITDVMMPGLDGLGLLQKLQANVQTRAIPVILLSARAREEARIEGVQAGANVYLAKPFSARELLARIESQLQIAHLQRENERRLHETAEYLRFVFEAAHAADYEFDLRSGTVRHSPRLNALFGFHASETPTIGDLATRYHPNDQDLIASVSADAAGTAYFQRDFRVVLPDGTSRWLHLRGEVLLDGDGKPERMRGAAMDITERKQRELNAALLTDISDDLAPITTPDQIMQSVADKMTRHFEITRLTFGQVDEAQNTISVLYDSREQALANRLGVQRLSDYVSESFLREMKAGHIIVINDVATDPRTAAYAEAYIPWRTRAQLLAPCMNDGKLSLVVAMQRSEPYHWRADEIELLQELAARIQWRLERARAEVALRAADERLHMLYKAERQARQEAEEANTLKIKFLGMISHELRTPLTSIKGFASTLLATDVIFPQESERQFLTVIDEEADKLTALVEQLLDLSRLQSGMLRIELVSQRFDTIVNTAMPQLLTLTEQHRLNFDFADQLPPVLADTQRVAQVLVNLVGNAVKFSPVDSTITIKASQDGQYVQIDLADEGIGIPAADREIVFEAFRQVDRKVPGQRLGAGLGLAICKSIIEAHHGRIWIQDQAAGTTISFTLPIASLGIP